MQRFWTLVTILLILPALSLAGGGHLPDSLLDFGDGTYSSAYSVIPKQRQSQQAPDEARAAIYHNEPADIYFFFDFDTTGDTIALVYTTDGSEPSKTNGNQLFLGGGDFEKLDGANRWWRAVIPAQSAGTIVRYVIYNNTTGGTLADADVRISFGGYETTWTEGFDAFVYTVHHATNGTGGGFWTNSATWAGGLIPSLETDRAVVRSTDTLTIDTDAFIQGFKMEGGAHAFLGSQHLSVLDFILADGSTFHGETGRTEVRLGGFAINEGSAATFDAGTGTVATSGEVNGTITFTGPFDFYNLEIAAVPLRYVGLDIGTEVTVHSSLHVKTGGYLVSPTLNYAPGSTVIYDTPNRRYYAFNEWISGATSGPAVPVNVTVTSGTILSLDTGTTDDFHMSGVLTVTDTSKVELPKPGFVFAGGGLVNYGEVQKIVLNPTVGNVSLGLTGVRLDFSSVGDIYQITCILRDGSHPSSETGNGTFTISPDEYFSIDALNTTFQVASGFEMTMGLPAGSQDPTIAEICRWTGLAWDCGRTSNNATHVFRSGITNLSDWAVGIPENSVDDWLELEY